MLIASSSFNAVVRPEFTQDELPGSYTQQFQSSKSKYAGVWSRNHLRCNEALCQDFRMLE